LLRLEGPWSTAGLHQRLAGAFGSPAHKPSNPRWRSQDAMLILAPFEGRRAQALAAVFDGHGPFGGRVSRACMARLPQHLVAAGSYAANPPQAFRRACQALHREIVAGLVGDPTHSGTTLCAALLVGTRLTVANVGDSRCCLLRRRRRGRIDAVPLTIDHKPDRRGELERIVASGGRVSPLPTPAEQAAAAAAAAVTAPTTAGAGAGIGSGGGGAGADGEDGNSFGGNLKGGLGGRKGGTGGGGGGGGGGDERGAEALRRDLHRSPPRVWLQSGNGPGLAMSRSIGDRLAHTAGVTHEPELTEIDLDPDTDVGILLASDGIWDVLTPSDVSAI
ncbi:unnamed protein product, partial [Phaeothamnion confervicola]